MQDLRVVVTGAGGQLGRQLCASLGSAAVPLTRTDVDLTNPQAIESAMRHHQPDVIVNAAAYTQVDRAESDEDRCFEVNAEGVKHLARVCAEHDCVLVQVSTDYVFDDVASTSPFVETDTTRAQGAYARSKLAGEHAAAAWEKHFIVRTCGLYGVGPDAPQRGRNFVDTMLSLAEDRDELSIVDDQRCTPTFIPHLSAALMYLVTQREFGIYHVTNTDSTTWFHFAEELFRAAGISMRLSPITTADYGAPAPRPAYSVLDVSKYHALGGPTMPPWQQGLVDYLHQLAAIR